MNCNCEKGLELKIKQGESTGFAFTLSEEGNPVDLTNSQMVMQVRDGVEDTGVYLINKTISTATDIDTVGAIISPTEGKFIFKVNDTDIDDLSTTKPYFVAIYHVDGDTRTCISANDFQLAKFLVLNP